jgi:hypothetical protein
MDPIAADDDRTDGAAFVPSDNTSLTSVLAGLAADGFTGSLRAVEGGNLHCDACDGVRPASTFEVLSIRRLEGASEPDEMMSVVAAVCPRCGARGVAVLGYGPSASADDADASVALASVPEHIPSDGASGAGTPPGAR